MIDIFTTGGTIDKVYFDALSEYQIGATALPDMLQENNVFVAHRVTQLMRKDSLELTDADRAAIHEAVVASDADMILVTHGTDTMVDTARVLSDISGNRADRCDAAGVVADQRCPVQRRLCPGRDPDLAPWRLYRDERRGFRSGENAQGSLGAQIRQ